MKKDEVLKRGDQQTTKIKFTRRKLSDYMICGTDQKLR